MSRYTKEDISKTRTVSTAFIILPKSFIYIRAFLRRAANILRKEYNIKSRLNQHLIGKFLRLY